MSPTITRLTAPGDELHATPAFIEECEGYKKLLTAIERDEQESPRGHDYRYKLAWVIERAQHYAQVTGLAPEAILSAWEARRDYWYMNYYQEANQPLLTGGKVRVFDTVAELIESIGVAGFRCPHCEAVSGSPYACDSGVKVNGQECDWKVYGLFGHLGKGVTVFVKEKIAGEDLFMPVAWEAQS